MVTRDITLSSLTIHPDARVESFKIHGPMVSDLTSRLRVAESVVKQVLSDSSQWLAYLE